MNTEYAIGDFSIKSEWDHFVVCRGKEELKSFDNFEQAAALLSDLHLSRKASDDELIGTKVLCTNVFSNGDTVIVVARIDEGYVVQPVGSNERMTVTAESLSEIPVLFGEEVQ